VEGRRERRLALTLAISVAVLVLNWIWAAAALRTLIADSRWYTHTYEVIGQVERARSTIANSAAGLRGYLLTGDDAYLAPYRAAVSSFHDTTARLQALTVDNQVQEQRIALLNQAMGSRLTLTDEVIEARHQQGLEAAVRMLETARSDAVVAQIRELLAALEKEEQRLLRLRERRSRTSDRVAGLAFLLANLLALGSLAAVWLLSRSVAAQRALHERELTDQREWFATTLGSIGDGVLATDPEGRIQFINPVTERLTGWTSAEAAGRPFAEVFRIVNEHTREAAENPIARSLREGLVVGLANHTLLLSRTGAETPIDDSAAPIQSPDGKTLGVVLVFRDVTERKQAEGERERLLERERQSRYAAESANRAKDSFLATASHELRTPLGVILGWTGILRARADALTVARAAEIIERNARAQAKLVDDMLDISRIVSGKFHIEPVEIDPGRVVTAAVESLRPAADEKGVALEVAVEPPQGPIVADPDRLQQVVWNLLSNAIKFTPKGGRVRVTLRRVAERVRIEVHDEGAGISPERLPHVFERFWQADPSSTRRHRGLGLGLAIVRHLVEMHGGTVSAESRGEGYGSTFAVELPVGAAPETSTAAAAAAAAWRSAATGTGAGTGAGGGAAPLGDPLLHRQALSGARILVVDDEVDGAEWVAELLRAAGAEVRAETSAPAALAALRAWRPDLLISDIGMPGEDGYSLMKRVRGLPAAEGGQTVALALTAHARAEDRMRALSVGYQMHASKPIDPVELLIVSASLLNRPL
jgi:PAS domain S-box-containing protein